MKELEWGLVLVLAGGCVFMAARVWPDTDQLIIRQQEQKILQLEAELKGMERGLGLSR